MAKIIFQFDRIGIPPITVESDVVPSRGCLIAFPDDNGAMVNEWVEKSDDVLVVGFVEYYFGEKESWVEVNCVLGKDLELFH